jgi:hypothetical protein
MSNDGASITELQKSETICSQIHTIEKENRQVDWNVCQQKFKNRKY